MFNYKSINLKLLGLSLFTGAGFYNANAVLAKLPSITNNSVSFSVHTVHKVKEFNVKLSAIKADSYINHSQLFARLGKAKQYLAILTDNNNSNLLSVWGEDERKATFNLIALEQVNISAENSRKRIIRTIYLCLFLLFFVPFGIFYPFLLFYQKLLNDNGATDKLVESNSNSELKPLTSFDPESSKEKELIDNIQAVVTQLQIAFAVKDNSLRQKLAELCSSVDSRTDRGIAELMRKTIFLLIDRNEWTHVSCSSESFPLDRTKTEFEAICVKEQSKLINQRLSVVGKNGKAAPEPQRIERGSSAYIVVTIALCTSHSQPSFKKIHTKNQLREELSKLGKIGQNKLIKFDLLWNPQLENQYLSNNELLLNYIDMIRLF